jgi:hypothetical protein
MRTNFRTLILGAAAVGMLAGPAAAASYYFRTKPEVSVAPQAFAFAALPNQNPGAVAMSAVAEVKGYKGKTATLSGDAGAAYQICSAADCSDQGSNWKTAATASLPETFYARAKVTASASYLGSAAATLSVGGAQATFTASTRAKDEAPDTVSFPAKTGAVPDFVLSEIRQLKNHEGVTLTASGTGTTFRVCPDSACASATFDANPKAAAVDSWVQLRQVAPAVGVNQVSTLRYGTQGGVPIEATWTVTGTAPAGGADILASVATQCAGGWTEKLAYTAGSVPTPTAAIGLLAGKRYLVTFKQASSGKTFNYFSSHASVAGFCANNHATKSVRMVDSSGFDSGNLGERDCVDAQYGWYMGDVDLSVFPSWSLPASYGALMGRISTRPRDYDGGYANMLTDAAAAYFRIAAGDGWGADRFSKLVSGDQARLYTCG